MFDGERTAVGDADRDIFPATRGDVPYAFVPMHATVKVLIVVEDVNGAAWPAAQRPSVEDN